MKLTLLETINLSHLPDSPGVYAIRNTKTGQCYVGATVMVLSRVAAHVQLLRKKIHHSKVLQRAYDEDGEAAFSFDLLEKCGVRKLNERELHWFNSTNHDYCQRPPAPFRRTTETLRSKRARKKRSAMLLQGKW